MGLRGFLFLSAFFLVPGVACAAGPSVFATIDRSGWPTTLSSVNGFDTASRAEILMFAKALLASEALDEKALQQQLGVKRIDLAAVNRVRERFWQRLLNNFRLASQQCEGEAFCLRVRNLGSSANWWPASPARAKPPMVPGLRRAWVFTSNTCVSNCGWRRCSRWSAVRLNASPKLKSLAMNWVTANFC